MTTVKQLPRRNEVPEALTWDLTKVFASDAAFETAFADVARQNQAIQKVQGTLGQSARALKDGLTQILDLFRALEKVYVYASMKNDQDTDDPKYQGYQAKVDSLAAQVSANVSFLDPEILAIDPQTLAKYLNDEPDLKVYQHFIDSITVNRAHVLEPQAEALIAAAGDAFNTASNTFGVLNNSDLKFPVVKDEQGDPIQLSNGVYSRLIESTDRNVRKAAFEGLYHTYDQFKNTLASTLSGEVKTHNYIAKAHHYQNARARAMASNHIPESVYDTLIEQVNAHLPLLHRYVALRKKILGLDELHMYDLYTPLTGEAPLSYTFEEAKATAKKALAVMGPDYLSHVSEIFENRYIDVVENQGKRSGAYSGGAYDTPPYELLNWQNNLNNLYTLVHETGHSVHSWYTRHNQPYVYGDYPIFVAEIASTTNENILTEYLLQTQSDPTVRAYILNYYLDGFKGTIFRQTQFAEFEHFIHQADGNGEPLTADMMSDYYGKLNARYYGPSIISDPQIALEWSRIPHFYMNYYVYQYATGFAAAAFLSDQIMQEKPQAREKYIDYLKSGSSHYAIDTMKAAGIDMTKPDYLIGAFQTFEQRLNELEHLLQR
ncbi:oligoendopeptidase F [Lactobacillus sp. CC-MHH1034]|uniref:oligoendopeptidase F n=1 Tax=Agrilactobacillus fermenti TaxID=2586909 RepID=UPI001E288F94|nr:oligoendopeptidase F [Agrilactobacillus fermenti]MCD2255472.1 oligoendopeptidase F [Agrilactobacillus fermenti]